VFDARTGEETVVLEPPPEARGQRGFGNPVFSPDGSRIAAIGTKGLQVFDARTGRPLLTLRADAPPRNFAFSRDGARIVATGEGGLHFFEPQTGEEIFSLPERAPVLPADSIQQFAFSPAGTCLAALGGDGRLRTWAAPKEVAAGQARRAPYPAADSTEWHRDMAERCRGAGDTFGLDFHLRRLVQEEPPGGRR